MNNIISTRVSVFRNLKDFKFENKLTEEQKQQIVATIESLTKGKMSLLNVAELEKSVAQYLKVNALALQNVKNLFVDKNQDLTINLFCGEHLGIVSTGEGFNKSIVEKALNLTNSLASKINFAYSDEFGYLMSDIGKIGSGVKIETNIVLNAIKSINKIDQLKQNVAKLGYSLNETKLPAVYTLSTLCNLGISEKQIVEDFENTLLKLQELENESIKMLDVSKHDEIVDKTLRSVAILNSAYMMNYDELYTLELNLRVGLNLQIINIELEKINKIHQLILNRNSDVMSADEMKSLAQQVQQILKGEKDE